MFISRRFISGINSLIVSHERGKQIHQIFDLYLDVITHFKRDELEKKESNKNLCKNTRKISFGGTIRMSGSNNWDHICGRFHIKSKFKSWQLI